MLKKVFKFDVGSGSEKNLDSEDKQEKMSKGNDNGNNATPATAMTQMLGVCPTWQDEAYEEFILLFKNFAELNDINESKKTRLLLNALGARGIKIMKMLPAAKDTWSVEGIVEAGRKLFCSTTNKYAARDELGNRYQGEGETVAEYAVALQTLAEGCELGTHEEFMLKSRFLSGLSVRAFKLKLYEMADNKTFTETVDAAILMESLSKSVGNSKASINAMNSKQMSGVGAKGKNVGEKASKQAETKSRQEKEKSEKPKCFNCGRVGHVKRECKCCYNCQGYGHKSYDCPEQKKKPVRTIIEEDGSNDEDKNSNFFINNIREKLYLPVLFVGRKGTAKTLEVSFEVDTGSVFTLISTKTWEDLGSPDLVKVMNGVQSASGHSMGILGAFQGLVQTRGGKTMIDVLVTTDYRFQPLLGTRALDKMVPNWREGFKVNSCENSGNNGQFLDRMELKYPNVFRANGKPIERFEVGLKLKDEVKPILAKPYKIPPALGRKVKEELDRMCKEKVIYPVEETDWASPMVVVVKKNGTIRICIDPSKTLNEHLVNHHFLVPVIDQLLANFAGKNCFSTRDLRGAYQQLAIDEKSQPLLTMNTPFGLYRYRTLPFGIAPAPSIFQRTMVKLFEGLQVLIYLDDIMLATETEEEMRELVQLVFKRMSEFNLKINYKKSKFFVDRVKFLGHVVSKKGIEPDEEKIETMLKAKAPTNKKELQSFTGLVEYYAKFIPRLNEKMSTLFKLLKKDVKWKWEGIEEKCFQEIKEAIASAQSLTHFDPEKELVLCCDASDKGICGVLCQVEGGIEKPVLFFSRTLQPAEQRYPILHREALALVYALDKVYYYIYGRRIKIYTDHKPLLGIFGGARPWPPVVKGRLERYQIRAAEFDFELEYRKGAENVLADFGSRYPSNEKPEEQDVEETMRSQINQLHNDKKLNLQWILDETQKDPFLTKLLEYIMNGWPSNIPKDFKHWFKSLDKLSAENGIVLFEDRVWMPGTLKKRALEALHDGHVGMVRMKTMAKKYLFWPGLSRDIESYAGSCETCKSTSSRTQKEEFFSWPMANGPWERIHIDFFHFGGRTFLIVVDAFSKWVEIKEMSSTDSQKVQKTLKQIFEMFGDPFLLVADNGPPFNSASFKNFLKEREIKYLNSPPYHPQSNGLAERYVRTVKTFLKRRLVDNNLDVPGKITRAINDFLFKFRNTPSQSDNWSPAEKMLSFTPRVGLNKLKSKNASYRATFPELSFEVGDVVWYRDKLDPLRKRLKAAIISKCSNCIYEISLGAKKLKAHVNQLSKYEFRHKLFDVLGAQRCLDEAWSDRKYDWCMGRSELTEAELESTSRPIRNRKAPERFEPQYFKTRQHRVRSKKK